MVTAFGVVLLAGLLWWLQAEAPEGAAADDDREHRDSPVHGGPLDATPRPPSKAPVDSPTHREDATSLAPVQTPVADLHALGRDIDWIGRVVDGEGRPVEGADVHFVPDPVTARQVGLLFRELELPEGPERLIQPSLATVPRSRTDADGRYRLPSPPPEGRWREEIPGGEVRVPLVVVRAPGYAASRVYSDRPSEGEHDLGETRLWSAGAVEGHVTDEDGKPIPDVIVEVVDYRPSDSSSWSTYFLAHPADGVHATTTDASGAFRLQELRQGNVTLAFSTPSHVTKQTEVRRIDSEATTRDIVLHRGLPLTGRVVDTLNRPIAAARVVAIPAAVVFKVNGGLLNATEQEAWNHNQGTRIRSNEFWGIQQRQDQGLRLMQSTGHPAIREVSTDAEGRFTLGGLPPHGVGLLVKGEGFAVTSLADFIPDGNPLEIVLTTEALLTLWVLDSATSAPVAGAEVTAWRILGGETESVPISVVVNGDEPGAFRLSGLGPEQNLFNVRAPGYGFHRETTPGVPAGEHWEHEILLTAAAQFTGRVVDADGTPIERAHVQITTKHTLPTVCNTWSGIDGVFDCDGMPAGYARAIVRADGFAPRHVSYLSASVGQVTDMGDIELGRGASLSGVVASRRGETLADVSVTLTTRKDPLEARQGKGTRRARTDETGRYRFADLPPGTWTGAVSLYPHFSSAFDLGDPIEVAHGESIVRDFVVPERPRVRGVIRTRDGPVVGARLGPGIQPHNLWDGITGVGSRAALLKAEPPAAGISLWGATLSDPNGAFAFSAREPAQLWIVAEVPSGPTQSFDLGHVDWDEVREVEMVVPSGELGGVVLDRTTRRPVAGFGLGVRRQASGDDEGRRPYYVKTDGDGRFHAQHLEPGSYSLSGKGRQLNRYLPLDAGPFAVGDEVPFIALELEVEPGASVSGILLDATDSVYVETASLRMFLRTDVAEPPPHHRRHVFIKDGRFDVGGLEPGEWVLTALEKGFRDEWLDVARERGVSITLGPGESREVSLTLTPPGP